MTGGAFFSFAFNLTVCQEYRALMDRTMHTAEQANKRRDVLTFLFILIPQTQNNIAADSLETLCEEGDCEK